MGRSLYAYKEPLRRTPAELCARLEAAAAAAAPAARGGSAPATMAAGGHAATHTGGPPQQQHPAVDATLQALATVGVLLLEQRGDGGEGGKPRAAVRGVGRPILCLALGIGPLGRGRSTRTALLRP